MKRRWSLLSSLILLASPLIAETVPADEALIKQGKLNYDMYCARCHGDQGKGDGTDAGRLYVRPRDLTSGKFKFKTTVQGTPPSDEDLMNGIIGHGLPGSGMPSFGTLETGVKKSLIAYVKTLSDAFKNQQPQAIPRPSNERSAPDLAKGREIYEKLQCALCHGPNGHANGTSAATLVDAWSYPIKVANLTKGWTYRGGDRPIDVYYRILAGIDGAPMPSYEGAATHEEIWQLSQYVASLQLKANWSGEIVAAKIKTAIPTDLNDKAWDKAIRTDINLQDYLMEGGRRVHMTVDAVSVQAVYNDDAIAFRLFWEDPVKNDKSLADMLMLALRPTGFNGDPRGNLTTMYSAGDPALSLLLWQASNPERVISKMTNQFNAVRSEAGEVKPAVASYEDGRWTLLISRPLKGPGLETIEPGKGPRLIGFAAWDGQNKETSLRRSASEWIRLNVGEKTNPHSHH